MCKKGVRHKREREIENERERMRFLVQEMNV